MHGYCSNLHFYTSLHKFTPINVGVFCSDYIKLVAFFILQSYPQADVGEALGR